MKNLFERNCTVWVRYSAYEWREAPDGILYLTPAADAIPEITDPFEDAKTLVVDALNVGRMCMRKKPDTEIQEAILQFALKYGLLGLMTALPTTPNFMDYEAVYLPKNRLIKQEAMQTEDYLDLFFPFEKPDIIKNSAESLWNVYEDRAMVALAMVMIGKPLAVNMEFQREYAERYDWLKEQFMDWIFIFSTCHFYYEDHDLLSKKARSFYQESLAAFDGIAPTYHIALLHKPMIVWDFHSLSLAIQMMFSFMLTDDANPLRICKHCTNVFIASRQNSVFCSPQCKNRYNVYKSRAKAAGNVAKDKNSAK